MQRFDDFLHYLSTAFQQRFKIEGPSDSYVTVRQINDLLKKIAELLQNESNNVS